MENIIKSKSLSYSTLRQFMLFTLIVLLLATPVFYFLTKSYYAEELMDVINSAKSGNGVPSTDLEEDIMAGVMIQYAVIIVLLSVSMFITLRFITKKLWNPFNDTLKKMEQFNLCQSNIPDFQSSKINEFERLNAAVKKLISKDKAVYDTQKQFTENASHELQTPLAIIKSKMDLLMQENLNKEQLQLVTEMYGVATRMSRINKNMLMLTKIDNSQFSEGEEFELSGFVKEHLRTYNELRDKSKINFKDESEGCQIKANKILLDSLLNNLVINAIRNTSSNGNIDVFISKSFIVVSNDARGGALDSANLFHRFNHTAESQRGTGLGLSIVKAICDYHNWDIKYSYSENKHVFTIIFKISTKTQNTFAS